MVLWVFGYGSLIWKPGFDFDEKVLGFIKDFRRVFDLACIDHRGTPEHPARTLTLEPKEGAVCWGIAYCVRGGIEKERATMQYLEKRESEYDKKALVKFYKVTKSLLAASCTRKIIMCGRIRPVTNKNSPHRSKNVTRSVPSVKLDERTVQRPHIIIAPCTEEGESLEPYVTNVLIFISTPDKISNRYYLGPAPLEEMARQIATANGPCGNNRDYLFYLEKAMLQIGHEDEYVTELANEVRRVVGVLKDNKTFEPHFAVKPWLSLMNTVRLLQKRLFWIRDNNQANSPSLPS